MDSVVVNHEPGGDTCTIKIMGKFSAQLQHAFRDAYMKPEGVEHFILNFSEVDRLDSFGSGLLLEMRRFLGSQNEVLVTIVNVNENIQRLFAKTKLDTLFDVSATE